MKLILIVASILALGAGVFAGMAVSRIPAGPSPIQAVVAEHLSIAERLQLSDAQREQMRGIWEAVREKVHQSQQEAWEIEQERDAAVVALLNDSQRAQYAALTQQAAEKFARLNAQRRQAFEAGVDRTRTILNDSQRKTYDSLIHDRIGAISASTPEVANAGSGGMSAAVNGVVGGGASGTNGVGTPATQPARSPTAR
jgi:hypothetical protein